ncbi:MAG TPA: hypothetical protein DFS52_30725, partial [Myxococcales bacterium]|nr:hypothetical protein [Myxococcales bacterium]
MIINIYCQALGITPPKLKAVAGHREANTFALLLVALLERGEAMSLADVAARFEEAGIAERSRALLSLQCCQPGRPPVYREGDLYHLDPHDAELDLWAFRLGLRPPKVARIPPKVVEETPRPAPETALTFSELDEAWKDASLLSWSARRLAVAVLDAHGGSLTPAEVVSAVTARTKWHGLKEDAAKFKRHGSAVDVLADGRWAIAASADATVKQARAAVRDRIAVVRRYAAMRTDPTVIEQQRAEWEKKRAAHGAELASLSRALLVVFPPHRPKAAALLDVGEHAITTFVGGELAALPMRLASYDILGGVEVRGSLRALGFAPGERRLAELGPPQKTTKLNRRGRTLKITTALLVQGSCGIGKPFGDEKKLAEFLAKGELTKLRRRLEADVKSLYALYEYGRLHGVVRLRWGFLDERIPAPWVHHDEPVLYDIKRSALAMNVPL